MFTIATITLEGILRVVLYAVLILLFLAACLGLIGCKSPLQQALDPDAPVPSARPALAVDETSGLFTWQYLGRNGVMVHQSHMAYRERGDLIAHYAHVRRLMVQAGIPTTITRAPDDGGKFRWSLYDETTGERVEVSDQPFASANAARNNYVTLRAAVLDCPPQDLDETTIPL